VWKCFDKTRIVKVYYEMTVLERCGVELADRALDRTIRRSSKHSMGRVILGLTPICDFHFAQHRCSRVTSQDSVGDK
jgi:hypothetical protein